jgi:hypothetical protein
VPSSVTSRAMNSNGGLSARSTSQRCRSLTYLAEEGAGKAGREKEKRLLSAVEADGPGGVICFVLAADWNGMVGSWARRGREFF